VRLVGHDWGGFAGFLMCLREPERIQRYLALNIIHPWPTQDPLNSWRLYYQAVLSLPASSSLRARVMPGLVRLALRSSAAHAGTFTEQDLDAFAHRFADPARADATARLYRASLFGEVPGLMRGRWDQQRLRTPTLLLFGERDAVMTPRMLGGFESHADDMRLELVPEAGHFIAEDSPELVATRALEFLAG
jgi:pimeloyl-ACP methyl ester carboxylesterase